MGIEEQLRQISFALLRFSAFSAHAVIFGMLVILLLVLRPSFSPLGSAWDPGRAALSRRLEGLLRACLLVSFVATSLILLLQTALISELDVGAIEGDSFFSVLESTFGQYTALRMPLLAGLAVLLLGRVKTWALAGRAGGKGPSAAWWVSWGVVALVLLATSSFSGHAQVATPRALSLVNDVIHLAAGSVWFAGIIVLAVLLPDGWVGKGPVDRLDLLGPVVVRFSHVALGAISVVAATGTLNSFLHLETFADLWRSSYGQALALKILLFFGILALGGVNHFFLRDRLAAARAHDGPATEAHGIFRKTIAAELAIAIAIMAATGLLVGLSRTKKIELRPTPQAHLGLLFEVPIEPFARTEPDFR